MVQRSMYTDGTDALSAIFTAFPLMLSSFHTRSSFVIHILVLCILIMACQHDLGWAIAVITTRNPSVSVLHHF